MAATLLWANGHKNGVLARIYAIVTKNDHIHSYQTLVKDKQIVSIHTTH